MCRPSGAENGHTRYPTVQTVGYVVTSLRDSEQDRGKKAKFVARNEGQSCFAGLAQESQRRGNLLRRNPDAADEILKSRVGAQGVVVQRPAVEIHQGCFMILE